MEINLIREMEKKMWEAVKCHNEIFFGTYVQPDAIMISNSYRCRGEEYTMALPDIGLSQFMIEQYETVLASAERIQNYYYVNFMTGSVKGTRRCHATSTWVRKGEGWRLIFHMHNTL